MSHFIFSAQNDHNFVRNTAEKNETFQVIVKHCAQQEISYSLQPPILKCIGNRYSIER